MWIVKIVLEITRKKKSEKRKKSYQHGVVVGNKDSWGACKTCGVGFLCPSTSESEVCKCKLYIFYLGHRRHSRGRGSGITSKRVMDKDNPTLWGHLPLLVRANSKESVEYILQALWRTRKTGLDATDRNIFRDMLQLQSDTDLDPVCTTPSLSCYICSNADTWFFFIAVNNWTILCFIC